MGENMAKTPSPSCGFRIFIFLIIFIFVPTFLVDKCSADNKHNANSSSQITSSQNSSNSTLDSNLSAEYDENSGKGNLVPEELIQKQIERSLKQVFPDGTGSSGYAQTNNSYYKDSDGLYHFSSYVMDTANVLGRRGPELESKLVQLEKDTGMEVAVLTVQSLGGADIESFSMRYAEKWKIGSKTKDNGLLITFALKDRAVRLETGYGTEGYLTDAKCARIIRNTMIPLFKEGKYSEGIYNGTLQAIEIMKGSQDIFDPDSTSAEQEKEAEGPGIAILIVLLWFIIGFSPLIFKFLSIFFPFLAIFSGSGRGNHHSGGGFGGGGFGGGFGGGHGGGFGGGGSSGHW